MPEKDIYEVFKTEAIQERMRDKVREIQGVNNPDDIPDPILNMLLDATAHEVYLLAQEFSNVESDLLEQLANLLIPDAEVTAKPAHAVAQAYPVKSKKTTINCYEHFSYKVSSEGKGVEDKKFDFTPLSSSTLLDCHIACKAFGKSLLIGNKTVGLKNTLGENRLIVGIKTGEGLKDLTELTWYLDFGASSNLLARQVLANTRILNNGKPVSFNTGKELLEPEELESVDMYQYKGKIFEKELKNQYSNHFVKIQGIEGLSGLPVMRQPPPELLTQALPPDFDIVQLKDLVWFEFDFQASNQRLKLKNITIAINCFPVLNRRLESLSPRFVNDGKTKVSKLESGKNSYFLYLDSIKPSTWEYDQNMDLKRSGRKQGGRYLIRKRGIEKFNRQEASEQLKYLFSLLKEESSMLRFFDVQANIKQLNEVDTTLNNLQKGASLKTTTDDHFIVFRTAGEEEKIDIKYWVTDMQAEQIEDNAPVITYSGKLIDKQRPVKLVKRFSGGVRSRDEIGRIQQFKQSLLNNDRLVTEADIAAYCEGYLANHQLHGLIDIEVKGITTPSIERNEGMLYTILVNLNFEKSLPEPIHEQTLSYQLNQKTSFFYPVVARFDVYHA